jgi:hypothetical protein
LKSIDLKALPSLVTANFSTSARTFPASMSISDVLVEKPASW